MLLAVNQVIFVASFVAYTLVVVAIGIYAAKFARRSDEDFFLAGRSLGKWVAALSASASSESGWVTLGLVGMGFRFGVQAYWIVPGCLLGFAFIWFVMAGRMRDRAGELGALTVPDFFAAHYQERKPILRVLSVVVILTAMLLYVAAQFAAAGKAFNASFPEDIKYQTGVLIGAGIVMVYTISGGFRAVCWTDFLQALLMLVALVFFPIYILTQHGGYTGCSTWCGRRSRTCSSSGRRRPAGRWRGSCWVRARWASTLVIPVSRTCSRGSWRSRIVARRGSAG
jgi:Na+/proline symporter